jgi:hypothetical protein
MNDDVALNDDVQRRITDAVREITERRAVIEQAKGILMFVYGIDADDAFDILRRQSQEHNVKLSLVAEQIMKDLVELSRTNGPKRQVALGGLRSAAEHRIRHSAERQLDGQSKTGIPMKDLGPSIRPQSAS